MPSEEEKIDKLFNKYKSAEDDVIESDGLLQFCEDLGVDPEDPVLIPLSMLMNAENINTFTKEEFKTGCQRLKCTTIKDFRDALPLVREYLSLESADFNDLYKFTHGWACEPGQRAITKDIAIALWRLLLSPHLTVTEKWLEFLESHSSVKGFNLDTWNQVFRFLKDFEKHGTEQEFPDSLPVVLDDFLDWYNEKYGKGKSN